MKRKKSCCNTYIYGHTTYFNQTNKLILLLPGWPRTRVGDVAAFYRLRVHAPHLGKVQQGLDIPPPPTSTSTTSRCWRLPWKDRVVFTRRHIVFSNLMNWVYNERNVCKKYLQKKSEPKVCNILLQRINHVRYNCIESFLMFILLLCKYLIKLFLL